jgi:hypothetical protein
MGFYPYDFRHRLHMHHWHRGPSRLLWFLFGAGVATWFAKQKECHAYQVKHCMQHRIPAEAYPPPPSSQSAQSHFPRGCPGQAQNAVQDGVGPAPAQVQQQPQPQEHEWRWHRTWEWSWPPRDTTNAAADVGSNNSNGGGNGSYSTPRPMPGSVLPGKPEGWEDETQRLQRMTQQATETVRVLSFFRVPGGGP